MKITLISPFPPGRGSGGWGQQSKLKAEVAGDKEGKPPHRVQRRQGQPAPQGASPPPGTAAARSAGTARGKPPAGCVVRPLPQCRPGSAAGLLHGKGCTCRRRFRAGVPGAAAPGKIILESPPSPEGKGAGGMGAVKQAKGRGSGRQRRQAPRRVRDYTTPPQCRPGSAAGHLHGKVCTCRRRSNARGCKGRSPLHEITLVSPFPSGEGGRGDGGNKAT